MSSDHSQAHGSGRDGAAAATAPSGHRAQTKQQERLMSFSWFIGLHIPILLGLCTGNTSLARSMWPDGFFRDEEAEAAAAASAGGGSSNGSMMAPPAPHPPAYGMWFPVSFFLLLILTAVAYFGTAFSDPGFVGDEYRRRARDAARAEADDLLEEEGGGGGGTARGRSGRNGYARVLSDEASSRGSCGSGGCSHAHGGGRDSGGEVRIDIRSPQVRRVLVDDNPAQQPYDPNSSGSGGSGDGRRNSASARASASATPASALGEAVEAAELSVGCTPPIAQPLMRTLGLDRQHVHEADQTADAQDSAAAAGDTPADIELTVLDHSASSSSNGTAATVATGNTGVFTPTRAGGYCSLCRLVKPDRAKHCYKCKGCVQKFDHHCPWVATCVGRSNHRYFLVYCWLQSLAMLWGISLNVDVFFYSPPAKAIYTHAALMALMIMQILVCGMLGMFHTWLAVTNQTTYQVIKMQDQSTSDRLANGAAGALDGVGEAGRRQRRREAARRRGEASSSDEEEEVTPASGLAPPPRLQWNTYHVGFARNLWRFFLARLPDEHALPRSIWVDDRWVHLPHATHQTHDRDSDDEMAVGPNGLRPAEVAAMARDGASSSAVVSLKWNGRDLPTSAADVAAFPIPDTPPMAAREAYTRPVRIIGHAKVQSQSKPAPEPDTDDDEDGTHLSSVRL